MGCRSGLVALCLFTCAGTALADRPIDRPIDGTLDWAERTGSFDEPPAPPPGGVALAPYNKLFLNRCASNCTIQVGTSNSLTDSWEIGSQRQLTPFPYGDATWQQVVACVKDTLAPFNINVTDVDPGTSTNHFEVMIAGSPGDLGFPAMYGGVAPAQCSSSYLNNALVFDFAKVWGGTSCNLTCVEDICSTAAQEIGHTWASMDHSTNNKDPMTYFNYAKRKYFQNSLDLCGSDCSGGFGPGGVPCTGTDQQSHVCRCHQSMTTQNSYQVVTNLFGPGAGRTPPTVNITFPRQGQTVDAGFQIKVDATDDSGYLASLEVTVDGMSLGVQTTPPFSYTSPTTLGPGMHHIVATAIDPPQTSATTMLDVVIGPPCDASTTCPNTTDACVGGKCVPGPDEPGGLGATCTYTTDCLSGQCASDGTNQHCTEACTQGQCPSGFGCLEDGQGNGFCWPGYDDSSGGCGCQSNRPGGPLTLGLLFAVGVFTCRRRRR